MAITTVNSGVNQKKGITYTHITDSSVDWTGVTNDTYFYDKGTDLPYYKNSGGTVISVFEEGSTDTNYYTTGTTLVGNTLYFDRTDSLSAYTANLSSLGGANELNDLTDVTTALPSTPTEADDGKILFYDHDISQWTTDDAVTHGTVVINAKKDSAGTIAKGLPVYLVGFDSDLHTVELANANSGSTMPVIGFTSEQLDNSNSKHVTTFGKLTGIDTSSTVSTLNPNGETWAVNDALYMSTTTGGLTKVRPTGGTSLIQRIAKVLKVDASGGQIFIFNTARTAGLPNLTADNVWVGDVNGIPQEVNKSTLGGNTLYSADDSLTGNRIVNLDSNSLTITGGTTNNATPINFEFGGFWQGFTRWGDEGDLQIKSNNNKNPLKVFKKINAVNPTLQVNSTGGGLLTELWSFQGLGGSTTKIDINSSSIKHYFGGGEYHRIQLGGGSDSGVYFWRTGFGHTLNGFVIGNTTTVGSENISLQGSTLVSDKFEIQTTTAGFLIPRLTTAQMNAISSPDTHLLVFNTDLNALYRYNGSAWVSMAAGYGIVSTVDSSGNPTFYATVKAAYDAGAGNVKLHTDYEETTSNPINIVDGRNIDLNGFTYSYNVADGTSIFEDNTSNNSIRITNGRLIRKNGTGGDHIINCNLIQTKMDFINVYAENENGACLNVRTTFNGSGSEFVSNIASGNGFYFNTGSIVYFGKYVNKSNGGSNFTGSELKFVEFICQGSGLNQLAGNVYNSRFIGNTGRAVLTGSNTKIYDCYLESPSNNALDLRNNSEVYNSTMVSDAAVCVNTVGTTATKMKGCIIQGSHSVYSVNALSRVEDCVIVNSGAGQAINVNASNVEIVNNVIRLESGTADGIYINSTRLNTLVSGNKIFVNDPTATGIVSANVDVYIVDNKIKGTTLGVNLGTGTNLWTATTDAQGNSVQL